MYKSNAPPYLPMYKLGALELLIVMREVLILSEIHHFVFSISVLNGIKHMHGKPQLQIFAPVKALMK